MNPTYAHLGDDWNLEIVDTPQKTVSIGLIRTPIFAGSDVRLRITECDAATARRIAAECDQLLAACNAAEPYGLALREDSGAIVSLCSGEQCLPMLLVESPVIQVRIRFIADDLIRVLQDALRDAAEELA